MNNDRQRGFSLMELLVAMMIIAVLATIGFRQFNEYSGKARYIKAKDTIDMVRMGLDSYHLNHGKYPDLSSFEAMVEPNSPMVKENLLPVGVVPVDPWGNPFEGKAGKQTYELKCGGDPNGSPARPPFTVEPGKVSGSDNPNPAAAPAAGAGTAK